MRCGDILDGKNRTNFLAFYNWPTFVHALCDFQFHFQSRFYYLGVHGYAICQNYPTFQYGGCIDLLYYNGMTCNQILKFNNALNYYVL